MRPREQRHESESGSKCESQYHLRDPRRRSNGGGYAPDGRFSPLVRKRGLDVIARRLWNLMFCATLLTSLVLTWASTRSIENFLRARIKREFPAILISTADRLDLWYAQRKLDVDTFAHSAIGLAEKIRVAIAEEAVVVDYEGSPTRVTVTVSIGVSCFRGDRKALLNDADSALYRAKEADKDCVIVES